MRVIDTLENQFICPQCGALVYNGFKLEVSRGSTIKWCRDCVKKRADIIYPTNEWIEKSERANRVKRIFSQIIGIILIDIIIASLFIRGFL